MHQFLPWSMHTLRSDFQGLSLIPLLTATVDTTYCDVVLIAYMKPCQFTLCNTGSSDIQETSIWGLGIIGGNVDEVEISTAFITQCPSHGDTHISSIFRDANTGENGERGRT